MNNILFGLVGVYLFSLFGSSLVVANDLHGLVMGVNQYKDPKVETLEGAVADALDLSSALEYYGAKSVTTLLDESVTRSAVEAAWFNILEKSKPGDTIMITFSGHGARHPQVKGGNEDDKKDEVLLLSGYQPQKWNHPSNTEHFIIDNQWRHWIKNAKDRVVITVFDSCHSGSLTRNLKNKKLKTRSPGEDLLYGLDDEVPLDEYELPPEVEPGFLPHEIYIGGAADNFEIPEVLIYGKPRGALSYYMAKALRGEADANGNQVLELNELKSYLQQKVSIATNYQQFPVIQFQGVPYRAVFSKLPYMVDRNPEITPILVNLNPSWYETSSLKKKKYPHIQFVDHEPWNFQITDKGFYKNEMAEVIGQAKNQHELLQSVEKWRFLNWFQNQHQASALTVEIAPTATGPVSSQWYLDGEQVWVRARGLRKGRQWALLNLTSKGIIQLIKSPVTITSPDWRQDTVVNEPYGADHLLAIEWSGKRSDFNALENMDLQVIGSAETLIEALNQLKDLRLGMVGFFTAKAPCKDNQIKICKP